MTYSELCESLASLLLEHGWTVRRLREEAGFGTTAARRLLRPKPLPTVQAVERAFGLMGKQTFYDSFNAADAETRICWRCSRLRAVRDFAPRKLGGGAPTCLACRAGAVQVSRHRARGDADPVFPFVEWGKKLDEAGGKCVLCGRADEHLVIDHIRSFAEGGMLEISNLRPVCYPCNHPQARTRALTPQYSPVDGL